MPDQFNQKQPEQRNDPFGNNPTERELELPAAPQPLALPPPHGDLALPQGTLPAQPLPGSAVPNWPQGAPPPPWNPTPPPVIPPPWNPTPPPAILQQLAAAAPAAQPGTPGTGAQPAALPPGSGPSQAAAPPATVSRPRRRFTAPTLVPGAANRLRRLTSPTLVPRTTPKPKGEEPSTPPTPPTPQERPIFTSLRAHISMMVGLVLIVTCAVPIWIFGMWVWWSDQQHQPPPLLATLRTSGARGDQLAWSPDGKYLAEQVTLPGAAAGDPKGASIIIWNAASGQEVRHFTNTDGGLAFAWSPDGAWLATTDGSQTLIWRAEEITAPGNIAQPVAALKGHSQDQPISSLAWSKDGQMLVAADDGGVDVFKAQSDGSWKQMIYVADSPCATMPCNRVASWSSDGTWLLVSPWHLNDGTSGVGALNTQAWTQAAFLAASAPLAWSPDGAQVVLRASDETTLIALRTRDWQTIWTINPNTDIHQGYNVYPQAAGWSPDNQWLAGSADGWVGIWSLKNPHYAWTWNQQRPKQHILAVNSLAWSPDGHTLALTTDGTANVILYDLSHPPTPN